MHSGKLVINHYLSCLVTALAVYNRKQRISMAFTFYLRHLVFRIGLLALVSGLAWSQVSACDLNQDGAVNPTDVNLATTMALGTSTCTANIAGAGVCNVVVVQRVINAALGGACIIGSGTIPHYVSLTWAASISPNVTGYNVYRATVPGGPYTKTNPSLVVGVSYSDSSVQAGQTYYYVTTAVNADNNESAWSNQAQAVIPLP
jgi:hypothetical protein